MRRMHSFALTVTALYFLLLGCGFYGMYSLATFKIDFSSMSPYDKSRIAKISDQIEQVGHLVKSGAIPVRQIETSSVGFPAKERALLALRSDVEFFAVRFGHYPRQISELSHLSEFPDYPSRRERSTREPLRHCEIMNLETNSYILSCDNFSLISAAKKEELLKSFDGKTERFYAVPGGVILYVPPPRRF